MCFKGQLRPTFFFLVEREGGNISTPNLECTLFSPCSLQFTQTERRARFSEAAALRVSDCEEGRMGGGRDEEEEEGCKGVNWGKGRPKEGRKRTACWVDG